MSSSPALVSSSSLVREIEPLGTATLSIHPDSALLNRIQLGDESAMAGLYDAHSRIVYSVAFRVLRDAGSAEDVLQDVFFRIWRCPTNFTIARGGLHGWLAIMARNRAIDVLRGRRPTDSVDDVPLQALDNVFDHVESKLMIERARILVRQLPTVQRLTLELAFFQGLTHAEIARRTNVPLGTIKTRIRSALQSLRNALRR